MTTRQQLLCAILSDMAPLSDRKQRAAYLVDEMAIDFGARCCRVTSQFGSRAYSVRQYDCDCPDFRERGQACKHMLAVDLARKYAETLAARMSSEWDETTAGLLSLERSYEQFLAECGAYHPPSPGLLTGFQLEAIGDDDFQRWHAQRRSIARGAGTGLCVLSLALKKPPAPWVAMITGVCPHYEFAREFLRGKKDYREADKYGSRGVWLYWELAEGLYESQELEWDRKLRGVIAERRFFRVADQRVTYIERQELVAWLRGSGLASSRPN